LLILERVRNHEEVFELVTAAALPLLLGAGLLCAKDKDKDKECARQRGGSLRE
jgi:hypothetical protein